MLRRILRAALENLGSTQAFPCPHRGFNQAWVRNGGKVMHPGQLHCRLQCPRKGARIDGCQLEGRKGLGELYGLPLAECR
jgi:hypothetical protein